MSIMVLLCSDETVDASMKFSTRTLTWGSVLVLALVAGCDAPNPDETLRAMLEEAEVATEERNTGFFRRVIARSYQDARGNDRESLINLVRGFFLTNTQIEALVRVDDVQLDGEDSAKVSIQVALLSEDGGRSLLGVDGDFYSIDLEFLRIDGDWQVIGSGWRRGAL
jgi:hypothetical protein